MGQEQKDQQLWSDECTKPPEPKKTMLEVMRYKRVRKTARKFSQLAANVSLRNCQDPAFIEFKETMRRWFPAARP